MDSATKSDEGRAKSGKRGGEGRGESRVARRRNGHRETPEESVLMRIIEGLAPGRANVADEATKTAVAVPATTEATPATDPGKPNTTKTRSPWWAPTSLIGAASLLSVLNESMDFIGRPWPVVAVGIGFTVGGFYYAILASDTSRRRLRAAFVGLLAAVAYSLAAAVAAEPPTVAPKTAKVVNEIHWDVPPPGRPGGPASVKAKIRENTLVSVGRQAYGIDEDSDQLVALFPSGGSGQQRLGVGTFSDADE